MTAGETLSERLADDIMDIIRTGNLGPGDQLASSRDLARRFEVTTPTVREALRRLEATGAVEFRHGSGTYVGAGVGRRLLANPHRPSRTPDGVHELIRARLVLEPPIAAAAARERDPAGLAMLSESVTNALHPPVGDLRPAVHFHVALAATSGNALLRETVEALLHIRARDQVEIRHRYDDRERDHAEHVALLEAVRGGDPDLAERLCHEHLASIAAAVGA